MIQMGKFLYLKLLKNRIFMNIKNLLLVFVLLCGSALSLFSQTLVSATKAITQDTLLTTIQRNSVSSKTVISSGQSVFSSQSGYVRILLSDDYCYDFPRNTFFYFGQ